MQRKIADEFNKIIDEACEDRSVTGFLKEVACSDDYDEKINPHYAIQLYDKNEDECVDWLNWLITDCGLEPLEFATLRDWDYILNEETGQFVIIDTDRNKTFIINNMFANYCSELLDILSPQKNS